LNYRQKILVAVTSAASTHTITIFMLTMSMTLF
jgi:hypothetical protein